jgi:dihydrofolate reductase
MYVIIARQNRCFMSAGKRKLSVFNNVSLDGYFTDAHSDISWAHRADEEWNSFSAANASSDGVLLFGRKTYDMMAAFWPTAMAKEQMPEVAEGINKAQKFVVSRTMDEAAWNNTTVLKEDLIDAVRRLKSEEGPDITVLGSGSIVAQLTEAGLIDVFHFALAPIVLGSGRTMFEGVTQRPVLRLVSARTFENGNVFLTYERSQ